MRRCKDHFTVVVARADAAGEIEEVRVGEREGAEVRVGESVAMGVRVGESVGITEATAEVIAVTPGTLFAVLQPQSIVAITVKRIARTISCFFISILLLQCFL